MRSGLYLALAAALVTLAATAVITAPHGARAYADQDGGAGDFTPGLFHLHHDHDGPGHGSGRNRLADVDFGLPGEHHHHHPSGFIGDTGRRHDHQGLFTPTGDSIGQDPDSGGYGGWSGFGESGFGTANFGFSNFWSNTDGFGRDGGPNSGSLGNWDFYFGFDSGSGGVSPSGPLLGFNWPPIFSPPGTGNDSPWNSGDPDFWQPTGDAPPPGSPSGVTAVPEPASALLFGAGLVTLALAGAVQRRRARA